MSVDAELGNLGHRCRRSLTGEVGWRLAPFIDHHVHLHLVDDVGLAAHGIAGVVDLGGDPNELARRPRDGVPRLAFAGRFLTAPNGYPSGRFWAPPSIWRSVTSASRDPGEPGGAETAVNEQAMLGATVVKVALNADAGPTVEDEVLTAIVACAHARGLPVVAHVQGHAMIQRALDASVDVLAHTPFTETLDSETIERAASAQAWISTLAIHDSTERDIAVANLAAFASAGGRVLYGTDIGNGDQPVGMNVEELARLVAAGLGVTDVIAALTDPWPYAVADDGVASFVPGVAPAATSEAPDWLSRAVALSIGELTADER